ncbi:MAG TPA: hypothetical protein VHH36_01705, partial [Candidatus Thermoplasmatota archaeon]|nr:hypothetical protein [Candidatus Thermoplasmatota archaeon]
MSAVASIEELNREYRARLAEAAKATYRNEDLLADWINAAKNEIMRTSLQGWRQCSGHLLEYLQQTGLHVLSITRTEAQAFIKWVETAPYKGRKKVGPLRAGSVLQHVLVGSSLFNYLRDVRGLVTTNPFFPLIKTFKKKRRSELRPKLRALFANEVPLALEGAETLDDYLLVLTPIKTGVRREEYATLRMDKINWKERSFEVEPHPRRTHLTAYFDEELEFFLKLKCQRNERDYPGNPYLNPSPQGEGKHVNCSTLNRAFRTIIDTSPLKATITSRETNLTLHSERRGFTSELKSRGCP